jgi:hypothetical protein
MASFTQKLEEVEQEIELAGSIAREVFEETKGSNSPEAVRTRKLCKAITLLSHATKKLAKGAMGFEYAARHTIERGG